MVARDIEYLRRQLAEVERLCGVNYYKANEKSPELVQKIFDDFDKKYHDKFFKEGKSFEEIDTESQPKISETSHKKNGIEFTFTSPITVSETKELSKAIIEGTLLVEGVSKNGNLYTIEEMQNIAEQSVNKPIYYGTKTGIEPNTGLPARNLHDDREENRIGKILSTKLDTVKRKITFIAEVVNTSKFPNIVSKIRSGFGISINGFVSEAKHVVGAFGKRILKIVNMVVTNIQLVAPHVIRGQDEAKVESVHVTETMVFTSNSHILSKRELIAVVSALKSLGEI